MTTTESSPREMATAYEPAQVEQRLYEWWEANGFFQPSGPGPDGKRQPFTVIMPPPNVTGELHLGHALTTAIEDILVRWHRMRGDDTLWLPGVDHAAIAVQNVVERELRREGIERRDIGREEFLRHVWTWVHKTRDAIGRQHRRLGASADWTRERFTMDEGPQRAVRQTFVNLYNDGLIYRGERLINWCPDCGTALSDLEVEHADEPGSFWYVRYPVANENGEATDDYIVIATTRPETIPADTAVAVHPEDDRYRHLIGRRVVVPTSARAIPVIADEAVSIEGGSGALKVTPGHDPVDFEIGQRHGLPVLTVIGLDARMTDAAGEYAGLDRFEARERVVADLEGRGLIEKIEAYTHSIGHCQRSGTIVEPLLSEQWFVRTEPLARPAIEAVRDGRIKFVPQRFDRTYFHWMENIRDWTISRQIWWGHRIPVWYCDDCRTMTLPAADDPMVDPATCAGCGSARIHQDEDTLDTWFSSGLWPHSTLGWPDPDAQDLRRYYPTQVMETGYDIIFFWVARMIMLSLYNMDGVVPFETVYLHGLVRAPDGSKMSKSKGNTVDPLQLIDSYGTDALRYALISSTSPGNDQRITDQRVEAGRNLGNKLWNASRFVLTMVEDGDDLALPPAGAPLPLEDRWILSRTERVVASVDELLGKFELGEAMRQARDFFWDEFADWYIEVAKVRVRDGDRSPLPVLVHVLDRTLRLLHPCMPFVTEEIWQRLVTVRPDPAGASALIVAAYPQADPARLDDEAEHTFAALQDFVRGIRNVRAEKRVEAARWVEAYLVGAEAAAAARAAAPAIEALARVRPLHIVDTPEQAPTDGVVTAVLPVGRVVLPMAGLFDLDAERARLQKQIAEAEGEVTRLEAKLGNEQFTARAPEQVVAKERERLATARTRLDGLRQSLAEVG
ncbi:MAG: valine--tRNA ligase [Dehalococcoidia bacterium]|nr:valine--tRNA ligase [Dehalococcoidia bacterium]